MRTAIRQLMGIFAQLDRAMIAKRMRNSRKVKAAAGGYAGYGSPAFSLHSVGGILVSDEREAAAAALISALHAAGQSPRAITEELNAAGVPSKRRGAWHPQTVARVLARLAA
jgi:DNA invertase Pin-like site-specific DNA recombinase